MVDLPHRSSRCTEPRSQPLQWINYGDAEVSDRIAVEMAQALSEQPLPPAERIRRVAAIADRLELAALGELFEGEEIVPVNLDPCLWELRWAFGREQFRLYHYEPPNMPGFLVALRFHRKTVITDDDDENHRLQDAEMALASSRLREGKDREWGPPDSLGIYPSRV